MWNYANIKSLAKWAWRTSLDFVYPRTCVSCGKFLVEVGDVFNCRFCRERIARIRDPRCERCGVPIFGQVEGPRTCESCRSDPPRYVQARSLFRYVGTGARIVHVLKYEGGLWLGPEIASLIAGEEGFYDFFSGAVVIPVPLHAKKLRKRGYNQADIIARAIGKAVPDVQIWAGLKRIRMTPSQTFLTREQRLRNMRGAFVCLPPLPIGRRLIVVDDVLTTGATLNAAISALEQAGAEHISAFTLAHG